MIAFTLGAIAVATTVSMVIALLVAINLAGRLDAAERRIEALQRQLGTRAFTDRDVIDDLGLEPPAHPRGAA